jgi:hypothetical protein
VALVADACACTNPSAGEGLSLGLLHARRLRDAVREQLGAGPGPFAAAWDVDTMQQLVPWYRARVREDRARLCEIDALREGLAPRAPEGREAELLAALPVAAARDPDLFRAMLEVRGALACRRMCSRGRASPNGSSR